MAVANSKSLSITAFDNIPSGKIDSYKHGGLVLSSIDSAEVAAADDDGSVYRMVRIPSNARIKSLEVLNDAIAGGTDYSLGIYKTADDGGAVVDADIFASVISMVTARTLPFNAMYEAGLDIANGDLRLWEMLGLTEDPMINYDICYTGVTVGTAAGTLALGCDWVK